MGVEKAPRETENNAYAKFWGDKQRVLWYVMVFSGVVNWTPSCITRLTSEPYLVSVEVLRIVYLGFAVAITRLTSKPYLVYVEALPVVY